MSDSIVTDLLEKRSSRRGFLREGGLLAVAIGAACKAESKAAAAQQSHAGHADDARR
ncbi:MAG TPA: hypothetical protein VN651_02095 [Gemmatimonadaceae bacterium]|nr:hypothetical protein [Gemmatimonadaceae bacterium]